MKISPVLLFHICSGTLGILSGAAAIALRKGSRQHGLAGIVFVASMLTLAASGTYMAISEFQPGNILGGTLTFYLVATAWMTARHRAGGTRIFDGCALLVIFALAAVELTLGLKAASSPTGLIYDYPPGPYFFLGSVAVVATVGDIRLLLRGTISGVQRIARHLWRMCFALFIASASVFLARAQLFPAVLRKTGVLFLLTFLPLLLMIFWLVRVRFKSAYQRIVLQYRARQDRQSIPQASIAGMD